MVRPYARFAALLLLFGLVWSGTAPCLCAAEPTAPADHCGAPLPGVRAGHHDCACPCMTSAPAPAERPDAEVRVAQARMPLSVVEGVPRAVPARTAPPAVDTSPPAPASPPAVLRI